MRINGSTLRCAPRLNKQTKLFLLAVLSLSLSGHVSADDRVVVKDLRAKGSTSSLSVVLAARSGVPGHAMVILGKEDEKQMISSIEAFGFYPIDATKAVFGRVPGKIADELATAKGIGGLTSRLILKVDKADFDKVEGIRARWASKKDYKVLESDCVSFVTEVADALKLKTPKRDDAKLPVSFLEKLVDTNK